MLKRFLTLLGIVIVLFLVPLVAVGEMRDGAAQATGPLGHFFVRQNTALRNFFGSLGQIGELRSDKEALQKQILELQQSLATREGIERENEILRQELGVANTTRNIPKVFARIVVSDPFERTYTIDAGSSQGISEGQPVVYQGALVGRIIRVRENTAVVRSITSPNSTIQVWIAENREKGLLVGEGNTVSLREVTQGVELKPDSIIETSGLGGSLPQGILIGHAGAIQSAKSDLSQSFRVNLVVDPNNLSNVFVLQVDTQ